MFTETNYIREPKISRGLQLKHLEKMTCGLDKGFNQKFDDKTYLESKCPDTTSSSNRSDSTKLSSKDCLFIDDC